MGIHRPYTVGAPAADYAESAKRFKEIERSIRDYLNEMNIPASLLDEMLRYKAESMHILTPSELSRFRLEGSDYVWQDQIDSTAARRYGIDKRTYLSRKAQVDRNCKRSAETADSLKKWITCRESILRAK